MHSRNMRTKVILDHKSRGIELMDINIEVIQHAHGLDLKIPSPYCILVHICDVF